MATLKDVAKEAGVSIATVSCALSGAKSVRPETKSRIMDAIEKLKYIPNSSARNLKRASSQTVSVILPDMKSRLYSEIFDGLSSYLQAQDYSINVAFSNGSPDIECTKIDEFITQNCAGLLIVTSQPQNVDFFENHILNYQVPVVFMDREPDSISASYIGFQNYDAFYRLTETLLKKGYTRIALICGPLNYSPERSCVQGFQDALNTFSPGLYPEKICVTNLTREDAFSSFFTSFPESLPEVLVCTCREVSYGVQAALEYKGLKTPEDLLLISLSEESWTDINQKSGIYLLPRPSTLLGEEAARVLLQNIRNPSIFEQSILELEIPDPNLDEILPKAQKDKKTPVTEKEGTLPLEEKGSGPSEGKCGVQARTACRDTIRFLAIDNPTIRALELLKDNFTRSSGIQVEVTKVSQNELLYMIRKAAEEVTTSYDLYTYDVPWLEYMVQNVYLADITSFTESMHLKELLFPENLRNCQVNDRFFGVPIIGGAQLLFYRRDLFENRKLQQEYQKKSSISLRAPRTWKEFNDIAAFFTREYNPDSPTQFGASIAARYDEELAPEILIRLWSYGGRLWDNYNRPTFATKENALAFQSLLKTIAYTPDRGLSSSLEGTVDDFCSGRTAMLITFSEFAQQISQNLKANVMGRVAVHMVPGKHPASIGWNIGLNPFSPRRESVFEFLSWACRVDTSFYLTILNGSTPVTAPYRNNELQKLYPWLSYTAESLSYAVRRNSPFRKKQLILPTNKVESILCQALRRVYLEGISVQESLMEAQDKADHLFSTYGYPVNRDKTRFLIREGYLND